MIIIIIIIINGLKENADVERDAQIEFKFEKMKMAGFVGLVEFVWWLVVLIYRRTSSFTSSNLIINIIIIIIRVSVTFFVRLCVCVCLSVCLSLFFLLFPGEYNELLHVGSFNWSISSSILSWAAIVIISIFQFIHFLIFVGVFAGGAARWRWLWPQIRPPAVCTFQLGLLMVFTVDDDFFFFLLGDGSDGCDSLKLNVGADLFFIIFFFNIWFCMNFGRAAQIWNFSLKFN